MRVGAFEILLFFICLNLSCYAIHTLDILPYSFEPIETPDSLLDRFQTNIGGSIAIIAGGVLTGILLNALAQGAVMALIIAALNMLVPVFDWIILGFPRFLEYAGVPEPIPIILKVIVAVVWIWFLIGIVAQRYME